ncbi:MAG TPA: ABC transporter permease [Anaerolineales bacterium]|nr:ABC transporter permease [Anaerolineales bacterium]
MTGNITLTDHSSSHISIRGKSVWLFVVPASALVCLFALPLFALLWRAVEAGLMGQMLEPTALSALRLSLLTSTLATLAAALTGTPLAFALARWPFRGRAWLELLIDLPVVLPPAVAGLALLMAFGRRGVFGGALSAAGISLPFTTAAVVVAQAFVAAPLYVRAARIGFASVDPQLEEAAYAEGANQWQLFRYVMLPVTGRAILGGLVLCWTRALGEFGATILFAGNLEGRTQTMPLAIYLGLERDLGVALALSALLLAISIILLTILRRLENSAVLS